MKSTRTFLIITTRTPNFNPDDVQRHYAHLDRLRDNGQLGLSGAFTDATGGAYIVTAASTGGGTGDRGSGPAHSE